MDTPERYLSTNRDPNNGRRYWRVIGFGGMPECADTESEEEAAAVYRQNDRSRFPLIAGAEPVWNGDAGYFCAERRNFIADVVKS